MSFDLVLAGGHVIDPASGTDRVTDLAVDDRLVAMGAVVGGRSLHPADWPNAR